MVEVANGRGLVAMAASQNRWVAEVTEVTTLRGKGEACRKAVVAAEVAAMVAKSRTGAQSRVRA
jgi:hypothetical protein